MCSPLWRLSRVIKVRHVGCGYTHYPPIVMLTLRFSGKRAGETDLLDEVTERRLYTARTFIAGNVKTAIYKCRDDDDGSAHGQFLARFHSHIFSSDELEIEGMGMVRAKDCVEKQGERSVPCTIVHNITPTRFAER